MAAEQGNARAQERLALGFAETDISEAIKWLSLAMMQGNEGAEKDLEALRARFKPSPGQMAEGLDLAAGPARHHFSSPPSAKSADCPPAFRPSKIHS